MKYIPQKKYIFAIFFFVSLLFVFYNIVDCKTSIVIEYRGENSNVYNNILAEVYWDTGNGYNSDEASSAQIFKRQVEISIPQKFDELKALRIDFSNSSSEIKVEKIRVRSGAFSVCVITSQELYEQSTFLDVESVQYQDGALTVIPKDMDAKCILNEILTSRVSSNLNKYANISLCAVCVVLICAFGTICAIIYKEKTSEKSKQNKLYILGCFCVVTIATLIVFMAGFSYNYGHPDEDVTAAAINYYVKYWGMPDFSKPEALNSFSNYGTSRLGEKTIYYFLAGKFSWVVSNVFHVFAYYRSFNVLLFLILSILYLKYGKKCPWMLVGLLFTPQLWYVFSYATSDAWDYFLAFLAIFGVLYQDSGFNMALRGEWKTKSVVGLISQGIVYGLLIFGKKNYYVIFVLAFLILLIKLINVDRKKRKNFFLNYAVVLLIFCSIIICRIGIDYVTYKGDKSNQLEIIRNTVISEKDIDNISETIQLKKQNVPAVALITEYKFFDKLYKSFCGYYGWLSLESGFFYYMVIFAIYFKFFKMHLFNFKTVKNRITRLSYIGSAILVLFTVAITFYHAWTIDFQAQGRYLLPVIPCIMWCSSKIEDAELGLMETKLIEVLGVVGMYSYIIYGLGKL